MLHDLNSQRNEGYYGSHLILTQYQINKGLKVFGERGEEDVATELRQLHVRDGLDPKKSSELNAQERASSLAYLMFLKEKRTGEL